MSLLQKAYSWVGQTFKLTDPNPWRDFLGQQSYAGKFVGEDSAMRLAVVWGCVRLLSETVGSLPLSIFESDKSGNSKNVPDDPLSLLLHDRPNAEMTSVEFREAMMVNLCLLGNAYAMIDRAAGVVRTLTPIPTALVTPRRQENGRTVYDIKDRGKVETLPSEKVFHLKGFGSDGLTGYSPIAYARNAMGLSMATEEYGSKFFAGGARPKGVLKLPTWLKQEVREKTKADLRNLQNQIEGGDGTLLLEGGMEYQPISIPPEEAQFLETRKFQLNEICRIFRVPPHMVADLDKATFSNIESQGLEFEKYTLRPYLTRWEQAIKQKLIPVEKRRIQFARFNLDGLLRADSAARAAFYSVMLQNGVYDSNEVRGLENRNSRPGADELRVQVNMTPLDKLGVPPPVPPSAPPLLPAPPKVMSEFERKFLERPAPNINISPAPVNVRVEPPALPPPPAPLRRIEKTVVRNETTGLVEMIIEQENEGIGTKKAPLRRIEKIVVRNDITGLVEKIIEQEIEENHGS